MSAGNKQARSGDAMEPPRAWWPPRGRRWLPWVLLTAGLVIFAVHTVVGLVQQNRTDARYRPRAWVDLDEAPAESPQLNQGAGLPNAMLRVAVAPVISPEKSLEIYEGFVRYLARQLGKEPLFLQRDNYSQVNDLVRFGRCDVALVCSYAFVRGQQEFGMQLLVVPQINGQVTYHSLILVPKSSTAQSLLDLRGTRFASSDILSNSGWLYPVTWLQEHGEDAERFFREHMITGSHDRSVLAVAMQFADGAAVDSLVYERLVADDPALAEQTKVIQRSPPFGIPPVVVPPQIDEALRQQLKDVLLAMHEDRQGRKVLATLHIDRFVLPPAGLFDSVRQAAEMLERH